MTIVNDITDHWSVGIEASYNGYQYKDDGTKTRDYVFLAASDQYTTGAFTFVLLVRIFLISYRQNSSR